MTPFEFATAGRILFGAGTWPQAAAAAAGMGRRALVVTGNRPERAGALLEALGRNEIATRVFSVRGEPTVEGIEDGVRMGREADSDLILAMGGGSAIDAGKAISAMMTNRGPLLDHLEVIGLGKPLTHPALPLIAIPTTAGTGAEVTRNAVLASKDHRLKVSLRSPYLLPKVAVVDPELTLELPRAVTASTGLDALTQLIEPYLSHRANPWTDGFCVEGMRRAARSLRQACEHGDDLDARTDMAMASVLGGMALANAGLGAVHGYAAPIGGWFSAPHGAVCAALLPHVIKVNHQALARRAPDSIALRRMEEIARILTGNSAAQIEDGIGWVEDICRALAIPSLAQFGVTREGFEELIAKARAASSMKANPIELTHDELREILERSL